jgi:secondary thiamine-phosphate synthase enzyme
MRQTRDKIEVSGRGRGFTDLTADFARFVKSSAIRIGVLTAFVPHTSASLVIQENADPDVRRDLEAFFARLVPDGDPAYHHGSEGPDDMPSHIRSALTQTQLSIPIDEGRMTLGMWQSVYLWEHRTRPRPRHVVLHAVGE